MLLKKLAEVAVSDIEALRENGVPESRFIDYKAVTVGGKDDDKREFLADVSAFANASGGDIILGVRDREGLPEEIVGIEVDDADKEKLRLGDLIRSGLEPRLSTVDMRWLPMGGKRGVMVIRVPRSWAAPHRVTLRGHMQFYMRNAAGKHPMNVDDLRQAFNLSETIVERVRQFREQRALMVSKNEAAIDLDDGPKAVLHIVPLSAFVGSPEVVFDPFAMNLLVPLRPLHPSEWRSGGFHVLEGSGNYGGETVPNSRPFSYTLAFRSGVLEAVFNIGYATEKGRFVPLAAVEAEIIKARRPYFDALSRAGVEPPFFVFLSLTDVLGCQSEEAAGPFRPVVRSLRHTMLIPEIVVSMDNIDQDASEQFRPLFNTMANGFGLPHSPSYTVDGRHNPRR